MKEMFNEVEKDLICPRLEHFGKWEVFVMTLYKLRMDHTFCFIADKFGISVQTASKYFFLCLEILYEKFKNVVVWPEVEASYLNSPDIFKELFPDKFVVIIDCFEVFIQHPGK